MRKSSAFTEVAEAPWAAAFLHRLRDSARGVVCRAVANARNMPRSCSFSRTGPVRSKPGGLNDEGRRYRRPPPQHRQWRRSKIPAARRLAFHISSSGRDVEDFGPHCVAGCAGRLTVQARQEKGAHDYRGWLKTLARSCTHTNGCRGRTDRSLPRSGIRSFVDLRPRGSIAPIPAVGCPWITGAD